MDVRGFATTARLVIEKTFRQLDESDPQIVFSRKGKRRSDLESTFYLDVIDGDPNCIRSVEFAVIGKRCHPGKFKTYYPYKFYLESEQRHVYRFASPHILSPVPVHCRAIVRSPEGTKMEVRIPRELENYRGGMEGKDVTIEEFTEPRKIRRSLDPVPLPSLRYGAELELGYRNAANITRQSMKSKDDIYDYLLLVNYEPLHANIIDIDSVNTQQQDKLDLIAERESANGDQVRWMLTLTNMYLDKDLMEMVKIIKMIRDRQSFVTVDHTMRFHVIVQVSDVSMDGLIRICQNFVQFEPAINAILQTGQSCSDNNDANNVETVVCKSNREVIQGQTNKERYDSLAQCQSVQELCDIMNPGDSDGRENGQSCFKLNLQGLLVIQEDENNNNTTDLAKTIEFRQHYGTCGVKEVANWVRFCLQFVNNSAVQVMPSSSMPHSILQDNLPITDQRYQLFDTVIQDRYLAAFYRRKRSTMQIADFKDGDLERDNDGNDNNATDDCEKQFARITSTEYKKKKQMKVEQARRSANSHITTD